MDLSKRNYPVSLRNVGSFTQKPVRALTMHSGGKMATDILSKKCVRKPISISDIMSSFISF